MSSRLSSAPNPCLLAAAERSEGVSLLLLLLLWGPVLSLLSVELLSGLRVPAVCVVSGVSPVMRSAAVNVAQYTAASKASRPCSSTLLPAHTQAQGSTAHPEPESEAHKQHGLSSTVLSVSPDSTSNQWGSAVQCLVTCYFWLQEGIAMT
jgi:hypothetical protein